MVTTRAVLAYHDGQKQHKIFLIAKTRVGFGKAKKSQNPDVDITMRVLPLRSQELDPGNWARTKKISQHHGNFILRNNQFYIERLGKNGIFTLEGNEIEKESLFTLKDTTQIRLAQESLQLKLKTVRDLETQSVNCLCVERVDNHVHHCYVQVIREVTIGVKKADVNLPGMNGLFRIVTEQEGWNVIPDESGYTKINSEVIQEPTLLCNRDVLSNGLQEIVFCMTEDNDFVE
ncbi:hypothetical protein [Candidatus Uabimicrobium amorphum]|uniref:FHA domain-containing protein n=1 Tax=Uabimicrobium amorphum TaxID=2596890 RepID=A0A5S9IQM4_UABAM|nr:hypothetical protein [Candidatus Uabimicrobium amorphum]BBM86308.1 hypothetical protein UABAM_04694 [Candidatus Uabimicrobium amorphum]